MIQSFLNLFLTNIYSLIKYFGFYKTFGLGDCDKASIDDIEILHRSNNFVIVNKRYDVLVNANDNDIKVTVQTQLRNIFPELANPDLGHEFNFIHRLDYATSGILCLPVHKIASQYASQAFEKRTVEKYYLAIVRGLVSEDMLDIEIGIGRDKRQSQVHRMVTEKSPFVEKPKHSLTRLLVLERGISHDFPATKVLLKPITGRRHQLRIHMNALGHTIVGDFTYSNRRDVVPYRMFLHAFRLAFQTPLEKVDIQTLDPFGEGNPRNCWQPVQMVNALDARALQRLNDNKLTVKRVALNS